MLYNLYTDKADRESLRNFHIHFELKKQTTPGNLITFSRYLNFNPYIFRCSVYLMGNEADY